MEQELHDLPGDVLQLYPCYELQILQQAIPGNEPGSMVLMRNIRVAPLGANMDPMEVVLYKWRAVWSLSKMSERDRDKYFELIEGARKEADQNAEQEQRRRGSNIIIPQALVGVDPSKFRQ